MANDYQAVFDKVATHLITQGQQALRSLGAEMSAGPPVEGCAYRGKDGLTCAVGCLISDEDYDTDWEGRGVEQLLNDGWLPEGIEKRDFNTTSFLADLQNAHDRHLSCGMDDLIEALELIAENYNLNTDVLDKANTEA